MFSQWSTQLWENFFPERRSARSKTVGSNSSNLQVSVKNGFIDDWEEEYPTVALHKASTDQTNDYRLGILGSQKEAAIVYEDICQTNSTPIQRYRRDDQDGLNDQDARGANDDGDSDTAGDEARREEKGRKVSFASMSTAQSIGRSANSEDELVSKDTPDTSDKEEEECKFGVASPTEAVVKSTADGGEDFTRVESAASGAPSEDFARVESGVSGVSSEALSPTSNFDAYNEQVKKRWQCIQTIMVGEKYQKKLKSGEDIPPPPNPAGDFSKRKWELAMAEWRNSLA